LGTQPGRWSRTFSPTTAPDSATGSIAIFFARDVLRFSLSIIAIWTSSTAGRVTTTLCPVATPRSKLLHFSTTPLPPAAISVIHTSTSSVSVWLRTGVGGVAGARKRTLSHRRRHRCTSSPQHCSIAAMHHHRPQHRSTHASSRNKSSFPFHRLIQLLNRLSVRQPIVIIFSLWLTGVFSGFCTSFDRSTPCSPLLRSPALGPFLLLWIQLISHCFGWNVLDPTLPTQKPPSLPRSRWAPRRRITPAWHIPTRTLFHSQIISPGQLRFIAALEPASQSASLR
jgi:hypothetical protein